MSEEEQLEEYRRGLGAIMVAASAMQDTSVMMAALCNTLCACAMGLGMSQEKALTAMRLSWNQIAKENKGRLDPLKAPAPRH